MKLTLNETKTCIRNARKDFFNFLGYEWWARYFAYGSPRERFRLVDIHVWDRARNLLRRRHKLPRATKRFGYDEVHGRLGVIEVRSFCPSYART